MTALAKPIFMALAGRSLCLGHGDPDIITAVQKQAQALSFAHTGFFTSEPAEELAEILIHHAPKGLDRVYLVQADQGDRGRHQTARQYHIENGEPNERHLIARKQSYHGNTLDLGRRWKRKWRRAQPSPLLIDVTHLPADEYVLRGPDETAFDYGQRMARKRENETRARSRNGDGLYGGTRGWRKHGRGASSCGYTEADPRHL